MIATECFDWMLTGSATTGLTFAYLVMIENISIASAVFGVSNHSTARNDFFVSLLPLLLYHTFIHTYKIYITKTFFFW